MTRWILWILGIAVVSFLLWCGGIPFAEFPLVLLLGWLVFLVRVLPQASAEPGALLVGGAALVMLIGLTHWLAGWLYAARTAPAAPPRRRNNNGGSVADQLSLAPRRWRLRWSVGGVLLVVFSFAAAISLIVIVHEAGWLLRSPEPWYGAPEVRRRIRSYDNLDKIGKAVADYHQAHGQLPAGGTMDPWGELLHSWETQLLPYLKYPETPRLDLPWNHPENGPFFRREMNRFLNPGVAEGGSQRVGQTVDGDGYGLSHYAANSHVFGVNSAMRLEDVQDGTSNTIMFGEIKANFRAWGDPVNWRDPAAGLQRSPDGFGGPWTSRVTQFVMLDGSVWPVSEATDPAVLKALATPAGGEPPPGL